MAVARKSFKQFVVIFMSIRVPSGPTVPTRVDVTRSEADFLKVRFSIGLIRSHTDSANGTEAAPPGSFVVAAESRFTTVILILCAIAAP